MENRCTLPSIAENWYKAEAQRRQIQAVGNLRPIPTTYTDIGFGTGSGGGL